MDDLPQSFLGKIVSLSKILEPEEEERLLSGLHEDESLLDRFSYFWSLDKAHDCLRADTYVMGKCDKGSEKHRNAANEYFKKKVYDKAMEKYNLSIMCASHPPVLCRDNQMMVEASKEEMEAWLQEKGISGKDNSEQPKEQNYRQLALAYGNRSLLMYNMKAYKECIEDIELAQATNFEFAPKAQRRFIEQKAKSYIALEREGEALDCLEEVLEYLQSLNLDLDEEINGLVEDLSFCREELDKCSRISEMSDPSVSQSQAKKRMHFAREKAVVPILVETNSNMPALSNAVKMNYTPVKGRHLVATRVIRPAEVVCVEKAFATAIKLEKWALMCNTCVDLCINPIPCVYCAKAVFCNEKCRLEGRHHMECNTLEAIENHRLDKTAFLAYRTLMTQSYAELKEVLPKLDREEICIPSHLHGYNSDGKYLSTDYKTVWHMDPMEDRRSGIYKLLKPLSEALFLTKLIILNGHFFRINGKAFIPSKEDIMMIGTTLLRHIMAFEIHSQCIYEMEANRENFKASTAVDVGIGIFPVLSSCRHSCVPCAEATHYGNRRALRTLSVIQTGDEITQSIGPHFVNHTRAVRQSTIMKDIYITCKCRACEEDWPTEKDLSVSIVFKCWRCDGKVDVGKQKCLSCSADYSRKARNRRLSYCIKDVSTAFSRALCKYTHITRDPVHILMKEEERDILAALIEIFDHYIKLPCKLYYQVQRNLQLWSAMQGNYSYVGVAPPEIHINFT